MRSRRRRLPVIAGLVVALFFAIAPATALAATGQISGVTSTGQNLQFTFSAQATGAGLDPVGVTVLVDGKRVKATPRRVGRPADDQRRAVILMDTSGSMQGAGLDGAKKAASAFLSSVPRDVRVGLVAFSDAPTAVVAPTLDRNQVRAAVAKLVANGETSLYDALVIALRQLGTTGERRIVLLSDGADTRSRTSLAAAVAQLHQSHVVLDAVGFRTAVTATSALQKLASTSAGRLVQAQDATGLSTAFRTAAGAFTSQLLITVPIPAGLAGRDVTLTVNAGSGRSAYTDQLRTRLPGTAAAASPGAPAIAVLTGATSRLPLFFGLGAVFLALLALAALGARSRSPQQLDKNRMTRVVAQYTNYPKSSAPPAPTVLGDNQVARSAVEWAGKMVQRRGMDERLEMRLDSAGFSLRPAEWLLIQLAAIVVAGLLFGALAHGILGLLIGGALGFLGPMVWLKVAASRRRSAFQDQLPDSLQLIASSLSSGYSFLQALDSVVREGASPISTEVGRALAEARLGVPVEDALDKVADRMGSVDLRWTVMAVRVQADVGGNLSEVLSIVAKTMRDRAQLRRHVRALSAEGRLSAYVLVGLPIGIALFTFTFRREYMHTLYTDPIGIALSVVAVGLVVAGSFWMKKLVKVEV